MAACQVARTGQLEQYEERSLPRVESEFSYATLTVFRARWCSHAESISEATLVATEAEDLSTA